MTVRVRARTGIDADLPSSIPASEFPGELDPIFNHGFTTRKDGHGFGLHSCALAAKELGGSLTGESAGPGQGATFTLTLPLARRSHPMADESDLLTHRLLMIDDNPAIHEDYRKILVAAAKAPDLGGRSGTVRGAQPTRVAPDFDMDSAMQGRERRGAGRRALGEGRPYSVAFVDMRMPPGWDGLETIENLWQVDPEIQVVICSAYSDYDWMELLARLGSSDKLIVIKKPFEPIEILQSRAP